MYEKSVTVVNPTGIHARPAGELVNLAKTFESDITITKRSDNKTVPAKRLMQVLTLGLSKGTDVVISAEGTDEIAAVDALVAAIQEGFGECG